MTSRLLMGPEKSQGLKSWKLYDYYYYCYYLLISNKIYLSQNVDNMLHIIHSPACFLSK
jgi:hypothetical protein